jgi:acyl carrier protein
MGSKETPTKGTTTPEVLATVSTMIADVIGDDFLPETEITMETSFTDDLELESIEFVALAERLNDYYGDRVDFVDWIADMELEEIVALRVGELVEYITSCLS